MGQSFSTVYGASKCIHGYTFEDLQQEKIDLLKSEYEDRLSVKEIRLLYYLFMQQIHVQANLIGKDIITLRHAPSESKSLTFSEGKATVFTKGNTAMVIAPKPGANAVEIDTKDEVLSQSSCEEDLQIEETITDELLGERGKVEVKVHFHVDPTEKGKIERLIEGKETTPLLAPRFTREMFFQTFKDIGEKKLLEVILQACLRVENAELASAGPTTGLTFKQFVRLFVVLSTRGNDRDKRNFMFAIYDKEGRGRISKFEVEAFLDCLSWPIKNRILSGEHDWNIKSPKPTKKISSSKNKNTMYEKAKIRLEKNFTLDCEEELIDYFTCTMSRHILHQGWIFITNKALYFLSKFPTRVLECLPWKDIVSCEKKGMLPTIEVYTVKEGKRIFTNLMHREEAYDIICCQISNSMKTTAKKCNPSKDNLQIHPSLSESDKLHSMIDDFFGKLSVMDYSQFESKAAEINHAIYGGFGLLEYFEQVHMNPIDRQLQIDIVTPPTKSGSLLLRSSHMLHYHFKYRWFVLNNGFLYVYPQKPNENKKLKAKKIIPLMNCTVKLIPRKEKQGCPFILETPKKVENFHFYSSTEEERLEWTYSIVANTQELPYNRYASFAPERENIGVKWFIDGEDTYSFMADAINAAKHEIFITGWWVSPEVFLKRDDEHLGPEYRLDVLLKSKAEEGVKIYIMFWHETKAAVSLNSHYTKRHLEKQSKNIHCIYHPYRTPLYWSHHQKIVIIDQDLAFIGGLDLCFGRWDTQKHVLTDPSHLKTLWPGKDYWNEAMKEVGGVDRPFHEVLDRLTEPRMGWHDIHCCLDGYAARDAAFNYIQRWNHHVVEMWATYPHLFPKIKAPDHCLHANSIHTAPHIMARSIHDMTSTMSGFVGFPSPKSFQETQAEKALLSEYHVENRAATFNFAPKCSVQILRSISLWSGSIYTESSILQAYLDLITKAEYFIYIENQYFISSLAGGGIQNEVASCLQERIRRAIKSNEIFRVIVLLPQYPTGGSWAESTSIQYVMKWQFKTINRGKRSLIAGLQKEFPDVDLQNYITFNSLRNYGNLMGTPITEQVYVHSKLIIVDDRIALIGSANLNDRSLVGDRDSEIAVIIQDTDLVESWMNGKKYAVGRFAHELRMNLWREHLGLQSSDNTIKDPIIESVYKGIWLETAKKNTQLFNHFFKYIPQDSISDWNEYSERQKHSKQYTNKVIQQDEHNSLNRPLLNQIKGYLIQYPLNFLQKESLTPRVTSTDAWLSVVLYQ